MNALMLDRLEIGSPVSLSWQGGPDDVVGSVRRHEVRSLGLLVDHPEVAQLGLGDLLDVSAGPAQRFHSRVLHVETKWQAYGRQVERSPSLVVVTATPDLVQATQHRRFVRVPCDLEVEITMGNTRTRGRCETLAARGLTATVRGPLPEVAEATLRVLLPGEEAVVHGLVTRNEPVPGTRGLATRHVVAVTFTDELGVDPRLTAYVLRRGYTPIPACLTT